MIFRYFVNKIVLLYKISWNVPIFKCVDGVRGSPTQVLTRVTLATSDNLHTLPLKRKWVCNGFCLTRWLVLVSGVPRSDLSNIIRRDS